MTKIKIAVLVTLLAAGTVAFLVHQDHIQARMREKDDALLQQSNRIAQLEAENERLSNLVLYATNTAPAATDPSRELLRLRGEVGLLRQQTNELLLRQQTKDSADLRNENTRLSQALAQSETNQLPPKDQLILRQAHANEAITTVLQAIKNYATNHNGQYPGNLDQLIASGDLGATNLAGNLKLSDFELSQRAPAAPARNQPILTLRVPIPKPEGGSITVGGGINDTGGIYTSIRNVGP